MKEIEALSERVETDKNVDGVRLDIASLIGKLLAERRDTLTYWDKTYFSKALSALNLNLEGSRASTAWLQVSLAALQNLLVPEGDRSERQPDPTPAIDALTFDQIAAEVRRLGGSV